MLSYLYWDPSRAIFDFSLPLIHRPILWYGFFFALGFFLGYWIALYMLRRILDDPSKARLVAERLIVYVVIGAVVGARLGDLLFYQNLTFFVQDPLAIFKVWEGGLASHGGAVGVLVALYILSKKHKKGVPSLTFLSLLDLVVVPTALAGSLIRIGNFFNQEILGKPTHLPWAVVFGHPADGSPPFPRHPVQLYEAIFYLMVFGLLFWLWRKSKKWHRPGKISGLFLVLVFGFRFFVEFLKEEQSLLLPTASPLDMGQLLSIPFVLLGAYLLFKRK